MASVTITKQQDKNAVCMLGTPAYPHSPLRYPGGKSRAVKHIVRLIPPDTKRLCSPFVGGASVELACATMGMDIRGYDIFTPLVNFWQCLLADPQELAERVKIYHPMKKTRFYELQKRYIQLSDTVECAAVFYALNRSSFSGTTLSGGMSPHCPRFNESAIERLRQFAVKNITITQADYRQSIADNADAFLYLDPPYLNGQKLYGIKGNTHAGFDHETLKEMLDSRDGWILSYNDCPTIREWYADYRIIDANWRYGMNNSKQSSEVMIVSHDIERAA